MPAPSPWRGVMVATAVPFDDRGRVDYDAYASHVRWLIDSGCDGVVPNGSLGEYQTLTPQERDRVLMVAVEVVGGARVMPGVAAYGADECRRLTERASELECGAVMLLPPNGYRADTASVVDHYRRVGAVGVPIVAYNNPTDTKVDLDPSMLAALHDEGLIVAVKEFSGDVRRAWEIAERAPGLDLLAGSDDVVVEMVIAGAVGWVAGYPNALPESCVELYRAARDGDLARALPLYRALHPLLRWDSKTLFVQAIKLSMDIAGRFGGPCRPPRMPLPTDAADDIRRHTQRVLAAGLR